MAENPYSDFRIVNDILDSPSERYKRALVVLPAPKVEEAIRLFLYLNAPLKDKIRFSFITA